MFPCDVEIDTVRLRVLPSTDDDPNWSCEVTNHSLDPNGRKKAIQARLNMTMYIPVVELKQVSGLVLVH